MKNIYFAVFLFSFHSFSSAQSENTGECVKLDSISKFVIMSTKPVPPGDNMPLMPFFCYNSHCVLYFTDDRLTFKQIFVSKDKKRFLLELQYRRQRLCTATRRLPGPARAGARNSSRTMHPGAGRRWPDHFRPRLRSARRRRAPACADRRTENLRRARQPVHGCR